MDDTSGDRQDAAARWLGAVLTSAAFLTRVPIASRLAGGHLTRSVVGFPLVGAVIGAASGLVLAMLFAVNLVPLASAGVAMALAALITGGLHEDGLADVADGFGGGRSRELKLEIMRDSRIGSYGVLALVLCLIIKAAALAEFARLGVFEIVGIMAWAAAFSRAGMAWLLHATPPARSDGLGAGAGRPSWSDTTIALIIGGALALAAWWWSAGLLTAIAALAAGALLALGLRALALRQIGGQTGDVCGALQMITETAMLAVLASGLH